jgi:serine phosphatase RsbU (regulator of sigma subunit)/anti-sigma regulatory factor (Ser/Thr protein kinase)
LSARAAFAPEPTAPSRARSFTREALGSWGLPPERVDDAVLLVSELVANAVQHAGTKLEVACKLIGGGPDPLDSTVSGIEVRVTDRHPARALPEAPAALGDTESERGRGLLLPTALAAAWGVTYTAAAKTVWFILPTSPAGGTDAEALANGDSLMGEDLPEGLPTPRIPSERELGTMDFEELVRRTVESARDAVGADAAYALVADEEGELRVRGVVGIAVPAALTVPPGRVVLSKELSREQPSADDGPVAQSQLSVPFLVDGRVTGVLGVGAAADGAFTPADSTRLQQVADRVAMSLERLRLSELERVRRGRVAFLAEASELLSSTLDQGQTIALTAQLVVPRLAAWCAIFLAGPAGLPGAAHGHRRLGSANDFDASDDLRPAYVWHEDESRIDELSDLLNEIAPPNLGRVMGGQVSSWSLAVPAGAGPEVARMASDAAWCFPLTARGRVLGAVVIGRPRGDRRWPDPVPRESLDLAEDLTRRAALALDNARLYERQRTTSQALQHSLLPPEVPKIDGIELAAEYEASGEANEVGGDFYDVFPVDDGPTEGPGSTGPGSTGPGSTGPDEPVPGGGARWRFAIGDVSGTGPEAAAVTGLARHTLRILAAEGYSITEVVGRLNRLILREGTRGRFITLLHGEIQVPTGGPPPWVCQLSLVCAGHPPPLLLRAGPDGEPFPVAQSQTLLGVVEGLTFQADEVLLYPGDVLLSVTDGVTERRDDSGRLLDDDNGLAGLLAGCRDLSAWAVASRIRRAVSDFGSEPSSDDMALLVLRAQGFPGQEESSENLYM